MTFAQTISRSYTSLERNPSQTDTKSQDTQQDKRPARPHGFMTVDELVEADGQDLEQQQTDGQPNEESPPSSQTDPPPPCKCGVNAVRLTSQTEKNPNRAFFKCSKSEGGCGYFEWADQLGSSQPSSQPEALPGLKRPAQDAFSQDQPEDEGVPMNCNCGAPTKRLQARTEKNNGRFFHKCSSGNCRFFQWEDEPLKVSSPPSKRPAYGMPSSPPGHRSSGTGFAPQPAQGPPDYQSYQSHAGDLLGEAAGGPGPGASGAGGCFRCGQEGHWARDCPNKAAPVPAGGSQHGGGSAYGAYGSSAAAAAPSGGSKAGECFKCGQPGHWASSCPNAGAASGRGALGSPSRGGRSFGAGSGGAKSGTCFKCGQQGHWANACTVR